MKPFKILLFLLLITNLVSAQWNKVEEIKSSLVFSALFSGDNIFVGTDTLYISRDRGLTWEKKLITGQPVDITAFYQVGNRTFAGTYSEGIYQSTDYGISWEPFSNGLGSFAEYASVFTLSGDTLFYGSDGGGIYFLKLSTASWQSYNQNLPSNYAWTINDLAVTNTNIIASGGASGTYYLRPKGSAEWTESRIQTPGGIYTTPNVFLAFADTVFAGSRWGIFRSVDNGYNWDSVGVSALPLDVVSLVRDNKRIYAGFTRSTGNDFFVWYSDDFGNTWNFFDHQFQYLHHLYIYDNKIWAATNDGLWFNELSPNSADPVEKPLTFRLEQNYPNPFNPSTNIRFTIERSEFVSLRVYNILGNEVTVLINEYKSPGVYSIDFDASGLASGVYLYKLQAGEFIEVRKMILLW